MTAREQEKEFIIPLEGGFHIFVQLTTKGSDVSDFVIVLVREGKDGDKDEDIAHYDCHHGFSHLDRNARSKKGLMKHIPCANLSWKQDFLDAIQDFKENAAKHVAYYDSH